MMPETRWTVRAAAPAIPAVLVSVLLVVSSCKKEESRPPVEAKKPHAPADKPKDTRKPPPPAPPGPKIPPWTSSHPEDSRVVYRLSMGGQPVGTLVAQQRHLADLVTTSAVAAMNIKRMGKELKFHTVEIYTEKTDGTPVSFKVELDQMVSKVKMSGVYRDGIMEVTGPTGTEKIQYNKEWLFPEAISRLSKAKGYKPGTTFSYLKFQPQMGMKGVTVTHQVLGSAKVKVMGKEFDCHKVKVTASVLPPQEACVDEEGVAYTMTFSMGVIRMEMELIRKDGK